MSATRPGDTHYPDKVLSLFEPETEAMRKGKAPKPTEFRKLVKIQEAEAAFITGDTMRPARRADGGLARPPTSAPPLTELGVAKVGLPRPRGRPGPQAKPPPPRQRWFCRTLRGRTGCEGRISVLERCRGLRRCRYRGLRGMERWVGLGVIANDLRVLARAGPSRRPSKTKR